MQNSFIKQTERLNAAGYPDHVTATVCNKLVRVIKQREGNAQGEGKTATDKTKFAVIPYIHGLSHGLKKIGSKYGVRIAFSAPAKLSKVCSLVNHRMERDSRKQSNECHVRHKNKYVPCKVGIVYQVPLTCGKSYIGESGRCINVRLREHERSLSCTPGLHLPAHCGECGCEPVFNDAKVVSRDSRYMGRKIIEAFHIRGKGERCVSAPSISLSDKEFDYLRSTCYH